MLASPARPQDSDPTTESLVLLAQIEEATGEILFLTVDESPRHSWLADRASALARDAARRIAHDPATALPHLRHRSADLRELLRELS